MSRTKQSVEERILDYFNTAPKESVEIVYKLVSASIRYRFPAKAKSVNKKANRVALPAKKSHVEESVSQE